MSGIRGINALLAVVVAVSACGSGQENATGTPEGLWHGASGFGRSLNGLILDDGTFWFAYSAAGNASVLAGFFQGSSHFGVSNFSTWNNVDVNFLGTGVSDGGVLFAAGYAQQAALSGVLDFRLQLPDTFNANYDSNYELTPALAAIAGDYSGSSATPGGVEFSAATISLAGTILGSSASGCTYTGAATPRAQGNVYNISITFDGGACFNGTATLSGVAYLDGNVLTAMTLNGDRKKGFLVELTKQ
jgi:hypothetical protein